VLTDEQWRSPSRCEGWSAQDVVAHLIGTNTYWTMSIVAGLAGSPTRVLAAFDPAKTPASMVKPMRSMSPAETFEQFARSNASLFDAVEALDDAGWATLAEAPPGHVPIRMVANHALWDSWIHERDILLPLGLAQAEEPDEIASCLRYVAALAPALALSADPSLRGSLAIDATDPEIRIVIDVDTTVVVRADSGPSAAALRLTGRAVDLVDMLTLRTPLNQAIPQEHRWLLDGLATVFDATVERV
jgi:uncharacterized protein (TIGR03083 family)